ncbi:MAG: LD-carboxypeptidase [Bacteroidia bacterium]|nr:LD-carboxypeptidase [Bacteroidia bacterium]
MIQRPPILYKGSTIGIIATARKVTPKEIQPALDRIIAEGFTYVLGNHLYDSEHQFSGTDEQRTLDLQMMLDNPKINAIWCARGGYGTTRILDKIHWKKFRRNPKWIIGYSDITVLLAEANRNNAQSIHGPMAVSLLNPGQEENLSLLFQILKGRQRIHYTIEQQHTRNRLGSCKGHLIGGNLSLLVHSIGTKSEPDFRNAILFIEDIDEYLYHIDRMMWQLKRSEKLKSLSGMIIGSFTDMKDNPVKFGHNAAEIIASTVAEYQFPVLFNFPAGHETANVPLIMGGSYTLNILENSASLTEFF